MATSDDYARATIQAGRDLGISDRGIIIGLATNLVEAGPMPGTPPGPILMYANHKVPESLQLPHDAVGSDGFSVGTFQQQVRRGNGGAWWWADTATCMDPYQSAVLFFTRLRKLDYNNTSRSPGSYAQAVQGSAFPDRYDARMAEASAMFHRLNQGGPTMAIDPGITKVMNRGGNNGRRDADNGLVTHTQEGGTGDAVGLANFCIGAGVSYNVVVDDVDTVLLVDDDKAPWAAMEANEWGFHLCFAGSFAAWSRGKWLETDSSDGLNEDAMLWRGARVAAAMSQKYGFPLDWVGTNSGWVNGRGVCGHGDFGQRGGGHTDPGPGFPRDEFIRRARSFLAPAAPPPNLINQAADIAKAWIGKALGDETAIEGGAFRAYENGHVYWRAGDKAAYVIPHGGMFEAYMEYGFEKGILGWPRREFAKVDGGAVQAFWGGVLLRKDGADHGYPVRGVIGDRYAKEGYETGDLGWPVSDEYNNGTGGLRQDFENGVLMFDGSGSPKILKGDK